MVLEISTRFFVKLHKTIQAVVIIVLKNWAHLWMYGNSKVWLSVITPFLEDQDFKII